ncbi:MAG: hypothetical protein ACI81W_001040, partial [Saprospiraceae bacterium]
PFTRQQIGSRQSAFRPALMDRKVLNMVNTNSAMAQKKPPTFSLQLKLINTNK